MFFTAPITAVRMAPANINVAACTRKQGNERLKYLSAGNTANGTSDRIAKRAQIVILERPACGTPAEDTRDKLNDEINYCT
jgi:hypothetical protein